MTASTAELERADAPRAPWSVPAEDVAIRLDADPERGLSPEEAARRLGVHGPNRPAREPRPAYLRIAARQLADPLVLLLVAAAAVSSAVGEELEAGAIAAIVVLSAVLGFVQEAGADRAVLALRSAFEQSATVIRGGREITIAAHELVPGDLLVVHEGDHVAADGRLVSSASCALDESALTGESVPVEKRVTAVAADTALAERAPMLYAGTAVTRGRARALVVATGDATEMGQVAGLAAGASPPRTPLQRRLAALSRALVLVGVGVTIVLAGGMLAYGDSLREAFLVGAAVAVAAVPEGLAATVTIALAQGAQAMARRGAIVRRLAAVETLGEATVIATDKTGTLTLNRLAVVAVEAAEGRTREDVLTAGALATTGSADPIDARSARPRPTRPAAPAVRDPVRSRAPAHDRRGRGRERQPNGREGCAGDSAGARRRESGRARPARGAGGALGRRRAPGPGRRRGPRRARGGTSSRSASSGWRTRCAPRASESILRAQTAGIRVLMLTGDHPATAASIARRLGLAENDVYAPGHAGGEARARPAGAGTGRGRRRHGRRDQRRARAAPGGRRRRDGPQRDGGRA